MRIYKYWVKKEFNLKEKASAGTISFHCCGGSDESESAAEKDAENRAETIFTRIGSKNYSGNRNDYEADIIEEIVERISDKSIVTRNRYGARVINTQELTVLDIDRPKFSGICGVVRKLFSFFPGKTPAKKSADFPPEKQKIFETLSEQFAAGTLPGDGWRIYETFRGFRLISAGTTIDPRSKELIEISKKLGGDMLYANLCRKQNCYRARISPKPFRMRFKPIRYFWPQSEEQYEKSEKWVQEYEMESKNFSVCRFVKSHGRDISENLAVMYHDNACCTGKKLA